MSAEPLKPCPFCGERPRLTLRPDDAEASTYFAAVACYCGGYSACAHKMETAPTADEAEAKVRSLWNTRATLDAAVAAARAEERGRQSKLENALWRLLDGSQHCGEMQWCGMESESPWEAARAAIRDLKPEGE